MKELELQFDGKGEVLGTKFRQLQKSDKAYLYELKDVETNKIYYEVFERRISKESEFVINGTLIKYEEKEIYPKSNAFGDWAWCCNSFEKAQIKFIELSNKIKKL